MSGVYNNWLKVQNPNLSNEITPMESGGFQKPFYFGGSQVPTNLGLKDTNLNISGSGLNGYNKTDFKPNIDGKRVQKTFHKKISNIHVPRYIKF